MPRPRLLPDARKQETCSDQRAERRGEKNRCTLEWRFCVNFWRAWINSLRILYALNTNHGSFLPEMHAEMIAERKWQADYSRAKG